MYNSIEDVKRIRSLQSAQVGGRGQTAGVLNIREIWTHTTRRIVIYGSG